MHLLEFHCGDLNPHLIISHSAVDLNLDIGGLSVNNGCYSLVPFTKAFVTYTEMHEVRQ